MDSRTFAERWPTVEAVLDAALELDASAVPKFLDGACGGDAALRAAVEAMLEADRDAGRFLEAPAAALLATPDRGDSTTLRGRTLGPYRIEREIGRGGMGVVYEAVDTRLGRTVALKMLPPGHSEEASARFLREARAVSLLDHPNLCTLHDIGETERGRPYLVMAFYRGETLASRLRRGPLPLGEALQVVHRVGQGLARAHAEGIVHRDVKPANVMLVDDGGVKVLDFGVARLAGDPNLTLDDWPIGTPSVMAPEQVRGEATDHRCDIWALGVLLHQMLTGAPPFRGQSPIAVFRAIECDEPPPLAVEGVPPWVEEGIQRALAKDPEQRPASVDELMARLRLGPVAPHEGDPTGEILDAEGARNGGAGGRLVVVLALALLVVPAVLWYGRPPSRDASSAGADDAEVVLELERRGAAALASYWRPGQMERALSAYQEAVDRAPARAPAAAGLARALWRSARVERDAAPLAQAEAQARRAVELDEHLVDGWVSLGLVHLALGRFEPAAEIFDDVVRLDPLNVDAWRGRGEVAERVGDAVAAEAAYRRALELDPRAMEIHSLSGGLAFRGGRYDDAQTAFERALEIDPAESVNYKNLAAAEHMQGRFAEAARLLQTALTLEPDAETYGNLGTLYYFQRLYPQALAAFEEAVRRRPGDPLTWGNLGDARRRLSAERAGAVAAYREALRLLRDRVDGEVPALSFLALEAEYQAKAGDGPRARGSLDELDRLEQGDGSGADAVSLFNAAQAAEEAGDRERALGYLERALRAGYPRLEVDSEPDLEALRGDRTYGRLVASLD